jgi:mRNA interferase HigB
MRIISKKVLIDFYEKYNDSRSSLESWHAEAKHAEWETSTDVKKQYRTASILRNNRVVFNICGNKYRLVVKVEYKLKTIYIRFIGTHKEYEKINAEEI